MNNFWCNSERWISQHYYVAVAKKLCREYWGSMGIGFTHQQIWSGCKEWWTTSERVQLRFDGWSRSVGTHEADESSLSTSETSNDLPWLRCRHWSKLPRDVCMRATRKQRQSRGWGANQVEQQKLSSTNEIPCKTEKAAAMEQIIRLHQPSDEVPESAMRYEKWGRKWTRLKLDKTCWLHLPEKI